MEMFELGFKEVQALSSGHSTLGREESMSKGMRLAGRLWKVGWNHAPERGVWRGLGVGQALESDQPRPKPSSCYRFNLGQIPLLA